MVHQLGLMVASGLTPPISPIENTLWVKTLYNIPKWDFGIDFPIWPGEGEVFIKCRYLSNLITPLGKDTNLLGNIGAVYQLRRNQWIECEYEFYQDGYWHPQQYYLLNNGLYKNGTVWTLSKHKLPLTQGNGGGTSNVDSATLTENLTGDDPHIHILMRGTQGYTSSSSGYYPNAPLNLSGAEYIAFDFEASASTSSENRLFFSICTGVPTSHANRVTNATKIQDYKIQGNTGRVIRKLATDGIFGSFYIVVGHYLTTQDKVGNINLKLYNVEVV